MTRMMAGAVVALSFGVASGATMDPNDVPLINRSVLFGNPDRASPQLSPDGTMLAFIAPVEVEPAKSVLNVWVGPSNDPNAAKPVTNDTNRGIRQFFWAFNNTHIVYLQDKGGDENWRAYSVDLKNGNAERDLTPFEGVRAEIEAVSRHFPDEIIVGLNNRNPQFHDLHRLNITTGEMALLVQNDGFSGYVVDDQFVPRFAVRFGPDGGNEWLRVKPGGETEEWDKVPMEDTLTTQPIGFDKSGKFAYAIDSRGRDTGALVKIDTASKEKTLIAEDPKADAGGAMVHPTENTVQAVSFTYDRQRWKILDESIAGDFAYLRTVADGDFSVGSRTLDDKHWIVAYVMDDGPVRYYRYDREAKKATFLFTNRKSIEGLPLAKMRPTVIKSRDDLNLVSYYTLPIWSDTDGDGKPATALPMVLLVHGGPWARDGWGFNAMHQWLANRGYAVLSVNFRGSTGFGKSFINAGNMEWAAKMHDDLIDAVDWAVREGIADPKNVAIMGGSYGGYATLVGLTFTPDKFAAGVDIVGPSNITTLLNTIPPYWAPAIELFKKRVGDHTTEEGRRFLESRSPLAKVGEIKKPLLIGQGANDPRVKQSESDQIVNAMKAKNIPVTYVLYPDEGHGFARPENRTSFNAVAEAFLAQHIGGRYQPIEGDFQGSSITIPAGADQIPGMPSLPKP
ncbi:MAG: S9 family peptidase [Phycisphaerae bacterium]|nr:S9 family peptidase [Phycisphaerae bacterium]